MRPWDPSYEDDEPENKLLREIPDDEFEELVDDLEAYQEHRRSRGDDQMESLTFGDY